MEWCGGCALVAIFTSVSRLGNSWTAAGTFIKDGYETQIHISEDTGTLGADLWQHIRVIAIDYHGNRLGEVVTPIFESL